MSLRPLHQAILSGCAAPAFAFIAINRFSSGAYGWAAMWTLLAIVHALALIGSYSQLKQQGASDV